MNTNRYEMKVRRYDLDWLRVLAFGLLILYHTGMYYVADWGWHIKSDVTSETLKYFMRLVNPWRMPLLFLVSGAALWFAGNKVSAFGLLGLRARRLLPPLIFGMLVIVPPQIYYQVMYYEGITLNYLEFYRAYLDVGTNLYPGHHTPLGLISWTHLWFIPYLLLYTAVFVVLKPLLDRLAVALFRMEIHMVWVYLVPSVLFTLYGAFLKPLFPQTFIIAGDWYYHALFFTVFVFGYLMAGNLQLVRTLVSTRWFCLGFSVVSYTSLMLIENGKFPVPHFLGVMVSVLNGWGWALTLLAWSAAMLNRPSRCLTYMNTAILPWYVLHQTITIILAWNLSSLGMHDGLEATFVIAGTLAGCALGYSLIRRFNVTRFLFGLKLERNPTPLTANCPVKVMEKC